MLQTTETQRKLMGEATERRARIEAKAFVPKSKPFAPIRRIEPLPTGGHAVPWAIDVTCWPPVANPRPYNHPYPFVSEIIRATAHHFKLKRVDIISQRRDAQVVIPRQIAMYLAKVLTPRSLPDIGMRFDGRDHTTVLFAFRKIDRLVKEQPEIREHVDAITRSLKGLT